MCVKRIQRINWSEIELPIWARVLIWLFFIGFAVFLGWKENIAIAFAFLSIGIATFFSSMSLRRTSTSLKLTRATQRPFLNVHANLVKGVSLGRAILALTIQNTGNLPADHVVVECSWYLIKGEGTEECSLKLEKASPSIVFPADRAEPTYLVIGRDAVERLTNEGGRVNVTVNYQNKLTMQRHTTQRTFCIVVASVSPSINTHQAVSIPEEDYWD